MTTYLYLASVEEWRQDLRPASVTDYLR